jgi:NADPH-dependent 2,4-dienoyl-CoA reductase/sulfur reductase-like enzyme
VGSTGLIVIGSGPAGVSAVGAFRKLNPEDPVRIVTDDPDLRYAWPALSKEFLRGDPKRPQQWRTSRACAPEEVVSASRAGTDVSTNAQPG